MCGILEKKFNVVGYTFLSSRVEIHSVIFCNVQRLWQESDIFGVCLEFYVLSIYFLVFFTLTTDVPNGQRKVPFLNLHKVTETVIRPTLVTYFSQ